MTELIYTEQHRTMKERTKKHVVTGTLTNEATGEVIKTVVTIDRFDNAEIATRNIYVPEAPEPTVDEAEYVPVHRRRKTQSAKEMTDADTDTT